MSETSFAFKTLTAQQAQALARAHITHFEWLLSGEGAHIRKDECQVTWAETHLTTWVRVTELRLNRDKNSED